MTIFLMAVHTSGHGFAVDSRWNVVFKRVDNAAGWCRDAMKNGLVKSVSEGWLPTQAVGFAGLDQRLASRRVRLVLLPPRG
jgi:hypothetical protein